MKSLRAESGVTVRPRRPIPSTGWRTCRHTAAVPSLCVSQDTSKSVPELLVWLLGQLVILAISLVVLIWCIGTMRAMPEEQRQQTAENLVHQRYFNCSWFQQYYDRSQSEPSAESLGGRQYRVVLGDVSYVGQEDGRPPRFVVNLDSRAIRPADTFTRQYLTDHPCHPS
jgi:hypothetical protein